MPELRRDPVIGRWVIIATERAKRPKDFLMEEGCADEKGSCPFCQGNEDKTPPEIIAYRHSNTKPNEPGWQVRVFASKFPVLQIEGELNREGIGIYDMVNGIGAHEIIVETPDHGKRLEDLPDNQIEKVIWAYRDRILDLEQDDRLRYVLIFKNEGYTAGASMSHAHSQLIATPIVPKRVKEELEGARNYYQHKERCIYCDMIRQELKTGDRLVYENDDFISFTPFASRFPFEVRILPKTHSCSMANITKDGILNFAKTLKIVLTKLQKVLDNPPYNYILHTAPNQKPRRGHWLTLSDDFHWHVEIVPRLTKVAGFEWGSGFYINPTPPEQAAKFLREMEV